MTDIFIFIYFGAIVVYDAFLAYREERTITSFMRHWYRTLVIIPFSVGVVFLGHFLNFTSTGWGYKKNIPVVVASGLVVLGISIVMRKRKIELRGKKKFLVLIPIIAGYFVGDLFW